MSKTMFTRHLGLGAVSGLALAISNAPLMAGSLVPTGIQQMANGSKPGESGPSGPGGKGGGSRNGNLGKSGPGNS